MKSSVDKLDGLNRKLSISIPVDRIQTAFDTAFRGIQKTAAIKGFRKGKAPIATIKAMYSEKVRADVIDRLVSETYREALQEHELIPLGYPKIDFEELDESKDFTFTAEFEIRPEVKVEKFEGLAVNKEKIAVNESKIDEVLGNIQNSQAELVPVLEDRPAAMGDSADIDFDGFDWFSIVKPIKTRIFQEIMVSQGNPGFSRNPRFSRKSGLFGNPRSG